MRRAVGLQEIGESAAHTVSSELLDRAGRRLGRLGLMVAGTIMVLQLVSLLLGELGQWKLTPDGWRGQSTALGLVVLSLIAFGLSTSAALRARAAVWGSAYQLLGAAVIAVSQYWGAHDVSVDSGNSAFLAVWIVLFPLVVPASPTHNGWVAFGCASTPVAVHLVWCEWVGHPFPSGQVLWTAFFPYAGCAVLALGAARLTHRLKVTASDAHRELRELGSYRLIRLLGEGGMGEVWEAKHSLLARPAAVKVIKAEVLSGDDEHDRATTLARFEREARFTAALECPHTIDLYDFGTTEAGDFYYAMELLRGLDLEQLVERFGPVPPSRAVEILRQVCESLAEAHALGLVHRDIKPSNIYLCRLGGTDDFVKVLDFGLVKKTPQSEDATGLTAEGSVLGTAAYMPPEQASGKDVDGRTDLYALGCVGYWLLTGRLVFEGSAIDVLVGHASEEPPPLSARAREPVPAELEAVLLRCLAKRPQDRPGSAGALAEELAASTAGGRWTQGDARRWWCDHAGALPARLGVPPREATSPPGTLDFPAERLSSC